MALSDRITIETWGGGSYRMLSYDPHTNLIELAGPDRCFWINASQVKSIKLDGEESSVARLIWEAAQEFDRKRRR